MSRESKKEHTLQALKDAFRKLTNTKIEKRDHERFIEHDTLKNDLLEQVPEKRDEIYKLFRTYFTALHQSDLLLSRADMGAYSAIRKILDDHTPSGSLFRMKLNSSKTNIYYDRHNPDDREALIRDWELEKHLKSNLISKGDTKTAIAVQQFFRECEETRAMHFLLLKRMDGDKNPRPASDHKEPS